MIIERASAERFDAICAMLKSAKLPTSDISRDKLADFLIANDDDRLVGVVGLEVHGPDALLRSLVVAPSYRAHGMGLQLLVAAEALARRKGIAALTLLTTTVATFFARNGYRVVERTDVSVYLRASAEFSELCPSSATCMRKSLA